MEIGSAAIARLTSAKKRLHLVAEHPPSRLPRGQQVIVAGQRHQMRIRYQRGEFLAVAHRNAGGRRASAGSASGTHLPGQRRARRCARTPPGTAPRSPARWCGAAAGRTPPSPHGCRPEGTAPRTPAGTPGRHGPSRPGPDRDPVPQRASPPRSTARTATSTRVGAAEHQLRDPLRMPRGIRHRDGAAL